MTVRTLDLEFVEAVAAAVLCRDCFDGLTPAEEGAAGEWWHRRGGFHVPCQASRLRAGLREYEGRGPWARESMAVAQSEAHPIPNREVPGSTPGRHAEPPPRRTYASRVGPDGKAPR